MQRRAELLDNRIAELNVNSVDSRPFNVSVLQPAMVADKPVKPNKALTLAAALLAGCVLGMGFATLREWKDARLRTPEEVTALLGMPLVGIVPQINRRLSPADRGQVLRIDSRSRVAEAYRSIRTSLHLGNARSAKTILVASPSAGDGKSTTAGNLAIAFAQAGERTLLMDCDLREPVQHLIFETDPVAGVSTVMPGETKLRDAVVPTRVANLFLLPCGPVPRNPAEMIASDRFKHLLKTLASGFDRVVIDSPPLEEVTDGRILAAAADVTVLVLRMNQSMRRSGVLAVTGLTEVGADVLGVVANDVPLATASRYDGGHWQYASSRGRDPRADLRDESTVAVGALPGGGEALRMADDGGGFSAESVSIRELDWPAERP